MILVRRALRLARLAIVAELVAHGTLLPAQARTVRPIVGMIVAQEDGSGISYPDVELSQNGAILGETFGSSAGLFRLNTGATGTATLSVRRLGYKPVVREIALDALARDTLRVALERVSLTLERVKVTGALCPGREMGKADTAVLAIFGQLMQNATRNRLLLRTWPFTMKVERTIADELRHPDRPDAVLARKVIQLDTLELPGEHAWRYAPGNLVLPGEGAAANRLMLPQLVDFADDQFIAAQCLKYAGLDESSGHKELRVDFQPVADLADSDVSGSMWLSPATFQLIRSTLYYEMPAPPPSASAKWSFRIDTRFKELIPGVPVIDRVSSQTTVRQRTSTYDSRHNPRRATEEQVLLDIHYLGAQP